MITIWVELPALDLERAKAYYEAVFQHEPTDIIVDGPRRITVLPGSPSVSLNQITGFVPTTEGSIPYFHLDEPLAAVIERVVANGGSVIDAPAERGDNGFFALVTDSEGNALTLHGVSA